MKDDKCKKEKEKVMMTKMVKKKKSKKNYHKPIVLPLSFLSNINSLCSGNFFQIIESFNFNHNSILTNNKV
jgi:hypothetical protein